MTVNKHDLQFEAPASLPELGQRLQQLGFVVEGKTVSRQEILLDSFDWRLFRQNSFLIETRAGNRRQLQWLSSDTLNCHARANVKAIPRFVSDLPTSALSDGLKPLLEMRALMPLALRRVGRRSFKLLNLDEKTVLRLVVEDAKVSRPRKPRPEKAVARVIRLCPVKGYDASLHQAIEWLRNDLGLVPSDDSIPLQIFRAAGYEPGVYSSKVDLTLDPGASAFDSARHLLLSLWKAAEANEEGIRGDIDSEFLHDFRVATRRTRSALSQLKAVFPDDLTLSLRREFAWLAGVTGPTRDLDVYLLAIPEYEKLIAEDFRPGLGAVKDLILRRRAGEFKKLVRVMGGPRYQALKQQWLDFLLADPAPVLKGVDADIPIRQLASRRIWRLYRKLLKGGQAITPDSPAIELHELRKSAKKLRYMLEFFKSLYSDKDIAAILKVMKALQQNLGDIQDYEVQADKLAEMAGELDAAGGAVKESFLAIGMLTAHLTDLRVKARKDFSVVFSDFDSRNLRRIFRKQFKDDSAGGDVA